VQVRRGGEGRASRPAESTVTGDDTCVQATGPAAGREA
jgi:hypothetical protein